MQQARSSHQDHAGYILLVDLDLHGKTAAVFSATAIHLGSLCLRTDEAGWDWTVEEGKVRVGQTKPFRNAALSRTPVGSNLFVHIYSYLIRPDLNSLPCNVNP